MAMSGESRRKYFLAFRSQDPFRSQRLMRCWRRADPCGSLRPGRTQPKCHHDSYQAGFALAHSRPVEIE